MKKTLLILAFAVTMGACKKNNDNTPMVETIYHLKILNLSYDTLKLSMGFGPFYTDKNGATCATYYYSVKNIMPRQEDWYTAKVLTKDTITDGRSTFLINNPLTPEQWSKSVNVREDSLSFSQAFRHNDTTYITVKDSCHFDFCWFKVKMSPNKQ